ncbi:unnamed protein product [Cylicocyclus nassatus]|uniref:Uncharacterized protein n=1 Tax=Cylicocyclus nassatus TaxID=53992 RepID=A0AA36DR13_CYLNA|nr:unnamed protein product [Cylicocyclus nassatus]
MPISIANAAVNIFQACCTILPFVSTIPPPTTLQQCQCPTDLYSDSLCPKYGPCNKDPKAVTYYPPPLCPVNINCEETDYLRFQFSDGSYIQNVCSLKIQMHYVKSGFMPAPGRPTV